MFPKLIWLFMWIIFFIFSILLFAIPENNYKINNNFIENYYNASIFHKIDKKQNLDSILINKLSTKLIEQKESNNKVNINEINQNLNNILLLTYKDNKLFVKTIKNKTISNKDIEKCESYVNKNFNDKNKKIENFKKCLIAIELKKFDKSICKLLAIWLLFWSIWFSLSILTWNEEEEKEEENNKENKNEK